MTGTMTEGRILRNLGTLFQELIQIWRYCPKPFCVPGTRFSAELLHNRLNSLASASSTPGLSGPDWRIQLIICFSLFAFKVINYQTTVWRRPHRLRRSAVTKS